MGIYINPITLSTMHNGSRNSSLYLNNDDLNSSLEESAQLYYKPNVDHPCPVHRCLNWLSDNKSSITKIPSDIVSDYQNWYATTEKAIIASRFNTSSFRRAVALLKTKMYLGKGFPSEPETKEQQKQKMKPSDFVENKNAFLLLNFNYNTNKPCCMKKVKSEDDDGSIWTNAPQRHAKKSIVSDGKDKRSSILVDEKGSLYDRSSKRKGTSLPTEESSKLKGPRRNQSVDELSDTNLPREWGSEAMPVLTLNKKIKPVDVFNLYDGQSLTLYLNTLSRRFSKVNTVPESYKVCYKFYLYLYPSLTDNFLLVFQRHGLKDLTKHMEPFEVRQLIVDLKADFLFDRRLDMIQNHSKTYIVLLPLSMKFINGLPHRPVHIYSENYENIAKAMSILEEAMPEIIQRAVFKSDLPSIMTNKWSCKRFIFRPYLKRVKSNHGYANWQSRMDVSRRFPSSLHSFHRPSSTGRNSIGVVNSFYGEGNRASNIFASNKRPRSVTRLSIPSPKGLALNQRALTSASLTVDDSESIILTDEQDKYVIGSNSSNENNENQVQPANEITERIDSKNMDVLSNRNNDEKDLKYVKRIKCPASVLTREYFQDRKQLDSLCLEFHCEISHLDPNLSGIDPEKDRQIKLTIRYNSKPDLQEFCKRLGLRLKSI